MRKFFTLSIALLLMINTSLKAQNTATITGTVKDNNNKAIQAVSVSLLFAKDSNLVKTAVTESNGQFEIATAKTGNFLVSYSAVGFEIKYSEPFTLSDGQKISLKTVSLQQVVGKLKEVVISAKKPMIEVKADKTVFNVEASINAQGSNALELLQKSPGVQVDNNDNISMKGKTGVKIYIDGKMMQLDAKDLAAYLKSINSNDIEAIEMISNPSAKYDASGNAGIVNLRLKKNKKFGTNGSVNLGFVQGVTPKGNGSLNLNYRDKKINLYGNVGGNIGRYENTLNLYRIQKDTLYDQRSTNWSNDKSYNVKAGADYFINSKNTIGIMGTVNNGNTEWTSNGSTRVSDNLTGIFVKNLVANNSVPGHRTNANFNLNYRYADTSGLEINFDGDYGLFRGTGRSYQPNLYYDNNNALLYSVINRNYTPTDIDIYTAKLDVEKTIGKGKLGVGAKYSYVTTQNSFDFFNDDANGVPIKVLSQSNSFAYRENVNALYVNYQRQLNEKWSVQAGVRMEQANTRGVLTRADGIVQADNTVDTSYVNFFPSAALTWNINKKHSLNLTFSRRIDRPSYQDLNPFENKLDELTYQKGNAFLRPQYTNNIELTHTFMGFVNTTVGYSYVNDYATQVTDTTKNATYVQQQNLATQQIASFNIGAPTQIKKWWNGYVNLWYNYQYFDGKIGDKKVKKGISSYGAYLQQSFTLGHNYTAEISGYYNGPSIWGATWINKPQGGLDIGLQKQILKKQASIKIAATDIFHTAPWKATSDFGGVYIKGSGSWESQTFRVNFSWRFGSNQIKNSRERQTGLENEAKRIKGGN